jgi:hypothetical protein
MAKEKKVRQLLSDWERKNSYTLSLSAATRKVAIEKFGTLGKAVEWAVKEKTENTQQP